MSNGSIVVGVDGSRGSQQALVWAVDEARRRRARLVVVHAWWALPFLDTGAESTFGTAAPEEAEPALARFVQDVIGPASEAGVELELRPVQGVTAAEALLAASRNADLLIVGSRGLGGFKGLLLGSVSQQCAHHTHCPLVIVPRAPETRAHELRRRGRRQAVRTDRA